jgi:hypothetical protein
MDYHDDVFDKTSVQDPAAGLWYSLKWYLSFSGAERKARHHDRCD